MAKLHWSESSLVIVIWSYDQVGQSHGGFLALVQQSLSRAAAHIWFQVTSFHFTYGSRSLELWSYLIFVFFPPHMVPGYIISLRLFRGFAMFLVLTFNSKIPNCSIVHCSEVSSEVYLKNIHLFNCSVHIFLEYSFNIYFICSIVQRFAFKKYLVVQLFRGLILKKIPNCSMRFKFKKILNCSEVRGEG